MTELVLQNYNRPSICFWGLSNEITMTPTDPDDLLECHKKINALVKHLDPTRLTGIAAVSMCPTDHPYLKIPDVVGYNHYFGWYGGSVEMNGPWLDAFHAEHPTVPLCVTEYGCEGLDWHSSDPWQGDYTEEYQAYYHEELIKQLYSRPYIFASFVWNMFDFGADARSEGGEPGQNHKGLVTFDRSYKKDAFYAYKAVLSSDPFVHIAGKRYKKRAEKLTRVTVYSNLPELSAYVNGDFYTKARGEWGCFKLEIPLDGVTELTVRASGVCDTAHFEYVEQAEESYILREHGAVLNWFEVEMPSGYFSLNDRIGDIIKTREGKQLFDQLFYRLGENKEMHLPVTEQMMAMVGGFSVLRLINTLGSMITPPSKDELLTLNRELNKIKKN
jgi:beta-galactosidase